MAQHDYIIANQSGAAFRSDLNNGLAAIVSQNSGAAQPSTTYAYQWWADTTTGLLKIRNAANNAWVTVGTLASTNLGLATLASPTFTGTVTIPSGASISGFAPLASPTFTGTPTVPSLNGGPLAGFRNVIINGNPTINQRGYGSGAATSGANQYTLDRWRVVTSGQNISFTDSANVRTVTAPAGGCEQVVEGLSILSGTYTLSWTGTATATVGGAAVANGGNVTLTGGTNATVKFSSGTFSLVQLEPGTVATPFERRSYGQELALCQRYFQAGTYQLAGYAVSTVSVNYSVNLPVVMRASPTVTGTSANGGIVSGTNTFTASTAAFVPSNAGTATGGFLISGTYSLSSEL
jgi:hypothetical protein